MAALFGTVIALLCTGTGIYNDACNKAIDAGTRQVGWRQQADFIEDGTTNYVRTIAIQTGNRLLTKDQIFVLGAGVFVYNTIKDQRLRFDIPTLGLCSALSNEITPTSYSLNVRWNLK